MSLISLSLFLHSLIGPRHAFTVFLRLLFHILFRGFFPPSPEPNPHHRLLGPQPPEPRARLLENLNRHLLLGGAELGQGGFDSLLNA